jgi:hypothetical protein
MKKLEGKVAVITEKARDLVLKVIGDGWQDSPFDPFWFAEYRHLTITPRDDIPNARLCLNLQQESQSSSTLTSQRQRSIFRWLMR